MDSLLQPPVATAFDAISSLISASLYLAVAIAALAYAPRDPRVRVFLAVALASIAPYGITSLMWLRGSAAAFSPAAIVVTALSLMLGSLALLHFTQLFPWRRPWIRRHRPWLFVGYAAVVVVVAAAALAFAQFAIESSTDGSGGFGAVSIGVGLGTLLVVLPTVFVLGVVVPFAGLLSLFNSWKAAKARNIRSARVTTSWMLVSQLAGGVLTILIIPLLRLVAPRGPWVTIAAALLFGVGLLMPVAFAVGVWKFRILDLDIDALA